MPSVGEAERHGAIETNLSAHRFLNTVDRAAVAATVQLRGPLSLFLLTYSETNGRGP